MVRPASASTPSGPAADDRPSATPGPTPTEPVAPAAPAAVVDAKPRIDPNPATLLIDPEELKFLKGLAELVATPRETKRLVNLYRLVRASLPADAIEPFLLNPRTSRSSPCSRSSSAFRARRRHCSAVCAWSSTAPRPSRSQSRSASRGRSS